jgi:hypothetical protein
LVTFKPLLAKRILHETSPKSLSLVRLIVKVLDFYIKSTTLGVPLEKYTTILCNLFLVAILARTFSMLDLNISFDILLTFSIKITLIVCAFTFLSLTHSFSSPALYFSRSISRHFLYYHFHLAFIYVIININIIMIYPVAIMKHNHMLTLAGFNLQKYFLNVSFVFPAYYFLTFYVIFYREFSLL